MNIPPSPGPNPSLKEHWESFVEGVKFLGKVLRVLFTLAFVGFMAFGGYAWVDELGWISHTKDTDILLDQNWIIGEYRQCLAAPDDSGAILHLICTNEFGSKPTYHTLPVHFWGRIKRRDIRVKIRSSGSWDWRCQRKNESVACWAIN